MKNWKLFDPLSFSVNDGNLNLRAGCQNALMKCSAYAAWRTDEEKLWLECRTKFHVEKHSAQVLCLYSTFGDLEVRIKIQSRQNRSLRLSGELRNCGKAPLELARFHYLDGEIGTANGLLAPVPSVANPAFTKDTSCLSAPLLSIEKAWAKFHVDWTLLSEPIVSTPGWALGNDVGIFTKAWDLPGWFFGVTGPGTAFGQVGLRNNGTKNRFFAGVLLDGILLGSGERRTLEQLVVRHGDWQEALSAWAEECARIFGSARHRKPLTGYCSWYQHEHTVTSEIIEKAISEIAELPVPPGGRTVQIDDGYQLMPGDWRPNARFEKGWKTFPKKIVATGSLPGLWLAPTAIHLTHPFTVKHSEAVQHLADGSPGLTFQNWGWCSNHNWKWGAHSTVRTTFLEPDHPLARQFIKNIITCAVKSGWRYLKLDFTYAVSTARQAYDRSKTSFETMRDLYALFRESAGEKAILNACIGEPARYALGHVDVTRLGGDLGSDWNCVVKTFASLLLRFFTNGIWWQGDPDVFYLRRENTGLGAEESRLVTGTIGLLGGVFLTSDFPSQWDGEARELLSSFWNKRGVRVPKRYRVAYTRDGVAEAIRFTYCDRRGCREIVALYNWSGVTREVKLRLDRLKLPVAGRIQLESPVLALAGDVVCRRGFLCSRNQPPHSLRVVGLR